MMAKPYWPVIRRWILSGIVAALGALDTAAQEPWEVVVKTREVAPGTLGEDFFHDFEWPVVAENGDVIFGGFLRGRTAGEGNQRGFFRATSQGQLSMIAQQRMPLELGRDSRLDEARLRGVTADGKILVAGTVSGSAEDFRRAWVFSEGEINEILRSLAPTGRNDGSRVWWIEGAVADTGHLAGRLGIFPGENDPFPFDMGIWSSPDGTSRATLLVREGDPLPGLDDSLRLGEIAHVALNRRGDMLVTTDIRDADDPNRLGSTQGNLLRYTRDGEWSTLVDVYTSLPDRPETTFAEFSIPTFNDRGYAGFTAFESQGSRISAWVASPDGDLRRVVTDRDPSPLEGDSAIVLLDLPGTNPVVDVDATGRAVLTAALFGDAPLGPNVILQSVPGQELQVVVGEGMTVPDRPSLRFGDADQSPRDMFDPTLTASGIGVFRSLVYPTPLDVPGNGLFQFDRNGKITTLIAPGDEIHVGPGDRRIVQSALMLPDDHATALSGIGNEGTLAVYVVFADSTRAILRTHVVPEPASLLGALTGFVILWISRRGMRHANHP